MAIVRTLFSGPRIYGGKGLLDRLPASLTINGSTVTPEFKYLGKDANGTTWVPSKGYGETLDLQAGTPPTLHQPAAPNLRSKDESVLFNDGGFYLPDNTSFGHIITEDIVAESVFKVANTAALQYLMGPQLGGADGWVEYLGADEKLNFYVSDGVGNSTLVTTAALTVGSWYHTMLFVNRNEGSTNGSMIYINGVAAGTGVDFSGADGDLTVGTKFALGAGSNGTVTFESNVALCSLWLKAAWHQAGASGPAEWVTVALARAQFLGFA